MPDLLSQIESMLESTVAQALREEADERGLQLAKSKEISSDKRNLKAGDNDKKVDEAEDAEDDGQNKSKKGGDMSKRPVKIPDELPANITVDMVIDGIDAIRSARSLKDAAVREEFEEYFNSLSAPEKIGLLAYVYGIAETLIGDSEGRGLDPSEEPYNVEMRADPQQSEDPSTASEPALKKNDDPSTPIVVGGQ